MSVGSRPDPDRPYRSYSLVRLQGLVTQSQYKPNVLIEIMAELDHRRTAASLSEKSRIISRLLDLSRQGFVYPDTEVVHGNGEIPGEPWSEARVLSEMGYRVGKRGEVEEIRHEVLLEIYRDDISDILPPSCIKEWGRPGTGERLHKLARSIASHAQNAKRLMKKYKVDKAKAIHEWECDLAWLKVECYDGVYDGSFSWPSV